MPYDLPIISDLYFNIADNMSVWRVIYGELVVLKKTRIFLLFQFNNRYNTQTIECL